ncbi:unnamed protein product [Lactuca virosa]|uniref:Uncharacterized protein n=1 Tax=Lactuca virosa TaxID=75947 RepID=A0AAU9P9J9_9ASTR|nr:unnamed protein product [Lactuca virosa]
MPMVKHGNPIAFIRIEIARNIKSSTAFFSKLWTHLLRRRNNSDSPSIQSRKLGHLRFQLKVSVQFQNIMIVMSGIFFPPSRLHAQSHFPIGGFFPGRTGNRKSERKVCSEVWNKLEHRIGTLEFDCDRKSMGVILSST